MSYKEDIQEIIDLAKLGDKDIYEKLVDGTKRQVKDYSKEELIAELKHFFSNKTELLPLVYNKDLGSIRMLLVSSNKSGVDIRGGLSMYEIEFIKEDDEWKLTLGYEVVKSQSEIKGWQ